VEETYNFADFENAIALGDVNCHSVRGRVGKDTGDGEGQSGDVEEGSLHFESVLCDGVVVEEGEACGVIYHKVETSGRSYSWRGE